MVQMSDDAAPFRKDNWAQVAAILAAASAVTSLVAIALGRAFYGSRITGIHDYFGGRGGLILVLVFWSTFGLTFILFGLSAVGGVAQLVIGHQPIARVWKWWLLALAAVVGASLFFEVITARS